MQDDRAFSSLRWSSLNICLCNETKPFLQKTKLRPVSVLGIWREIHSSVWGSTLSSKPNMCNYHGSYYLLFVVYLLPWWTFYMYLCRAVMSLNNHGYDRHLIPILYARKRKFNGYITCSKSHNQYVKQEFFEPRFVWFRRPCSEWKYRVWLESLPLKPDWASVFTLPLGNWWYRDLDQITDSPWTSVFSFVMWGVVVVPIW